jgi:hypothetical protein
MAIGQRPESRPKVPVWGTPSGTSLEHSPRLRVPTSSGSNRYSCPAELSRQGPVVHTERARHNRERRARLVLSRGHGNGLVGHLADDAPASDDGPLEMGHDGGPVDFVPTGERLDRGAGSVLLDHLLDLRVGKSAEHRV